jgi:hypothetical protein
MSSLCVYLVITMCVLYHNSVCSTSPFFVYYVITVWVLCHLCICHNSMSSDHCAFTMSSLCVLCHHFVYYDIAVHLLFHMSSFCVVYVITVSILTLRVPCHPYVCTMSAVCVYHVITMCVSCHPYACTMSSLCVYHVIHMCVSCHHYVCTMFSLMCVPCHPYVCIMCYRCDDHGNYAPQQCYDGLNLCWCVHPQNGSRIEHTMQKGNPDCRGGMKNTFCFDSNQSWSRKSHSVTVATSCQGKKYILFV